MEEEEEEREEEHGLRRSARTKKKTAKMIALEAAKKKVAKGLGPMEPIIASITEDYDEDEKKQALDIVTAKRLEYEKTKLIKGKGRKDDDKPSTSGTYKRAIPEEDSKLIKQFLKKPEFDKPSPKCKKSPYKDKEREDEVDASTAIQQSVVSTHQQLDKPSPKSKKKNYQDKEHEEEFKVPTARAELATSAKRNLMSN